MWDWLGRHRNPVILFLIALLLIGGAIFFYYRQTTPSGALEMSLAPPQEIAVEVSGEVVNPDVYMLPRGARVQDAIEAAGGLTPDAYTQELNLAHRLWDEDQVHIPKVGEVPQRVNINTADAWLLEALPGIGEVRANDIVESRNEEGLFTRPHELVERGLIPQSVFDDIENLITV